VGRAGLADRSGMAHTTHSIHRRPGRRGALVVSAVLCALIATLLLVPSANALPDRTGVFSGKAVHDAFSFAPDAEPYESSIVVRVNNRRVTGIHVDVRLECPEVSIIDLRFSKLVLREKPRLTAADGFVFQRNGIKVTGHVGARKAYGKVEASKGSCKSPGATWEARRTRTL
jgi:hypothetical protein